jgi:hypothetical protein
MAEPVETKDIDETSQTIYEVSIDGTDVGYVDDIEVEIKYSTQPRMLQQIGKKQVLGHRLDGVEATVKGKFRQTGREQLKLFFPWCPTGPMAFSPVTLGVDLYSYAKEVILHPLYMGADATRDRIFNKAVIITGPKEKADGSDDDALEFQMFAYPDRSELPDVVIGRIPLS